MTRQAPPRVRADPGPWRQDAFVAVATFVAGVCGYGFSLVLSHALGPSAFGELSALLAVIIVATVPGVAVQAGIARSISAAPERRDDAVLLGRTAAVAVGVGALLLLAAPLLRATLGVRSWASVFWLAAVLVPTTFSFGCLGVLQGRRRFVALGWLLVLVQAAKLAAGLFAAGTRTGIGGALGATAVLTTAVVAVALVGVAARPAAWRRVRPARPGRLPRLPRFASVLARDAIAVLGVLLLSNLDLVLARHYLDGHAAGLYAAGNLITKVAFWGPSFVSTVAYPRLARADERRPALAKAVMVLTVLGVITTVGALVATPLIPVVIGHAYRPVEPLVWLFALQGAALAGVLLAVYAGLAVNDRRLAVLVWIVAFAEVAAVALRWHGSVSQVLAVVLCGSAALLLAAAWQHRELLRRAVPASA